MKVSLNIAKKYTDIKVEEEELISKVKSQLGEVEEVKNFANKYKKTVLAEIVKKEDHPDADKLAVYQIDVGKKEQIQVVAGDKSLEPGDRVAYFYPGAIVPFNAYPAKFDGVVTAVKLRGVMSNGMVASARELDLNDNHEQVLRIESKEKLGTPIAEVLDMNDTVIDIENKALTNRADCFGLIGITRELAGIQGIQFITPDWMTSKAKYPKSNSLVELPLSVDIDSPSLCKRYMGATLSNIKVKDSPIWLQSALVRLGMRPINNVVDITNYIMLLTGQPLHAFDYDKLKEKDPNAKTSAHIVVRRAINNEKITTLDGKTHELTDTNLMICDSENPIAIAGIMGGLDTEIDEKTTNIVLESANFDLYNNRKSSMKLGIFTDAVTRFSKGQDPNLCLPALFRAIEMLQDLAGGKVSEIHDEYPEEELYTERLISLSVAKLNHHLGLDLKPGNIKDILDHVELWAEVKGDIVNVTIPTYRNDIRIAEDLHEEVARLYGYNNVPITLPSRSIKPVHKNDMLELKKKVRLILGSYGANEILTYNFTSMKKLTHHKLDPEHAYRLKNALSPELEYMRTSLLPSLLEKTRVNIKAAHKFVTMYEINKTHNSSVLDEEELPYELENLSLVVSGVDEFVKENLSGSAYYQAKYHLDKVLEQLNVSNISYLDPDRMNKDLLPAWVGNILPMFDVNAVAVVAYESEVGNNLLGIIGEFSPNSKAAEKLPKYTAGFELDMRVLQSMRSKLSNYQEPSHYPPVSYDICFIVDKDVPYSAIIDTANNELSEEEEILYTIEPVDIYQSKNLLKKGQKYVTIRVSLRHNDKTLSSKEGEEIYKRLTRGVKKSTNAKVKE